MAISVVTGMGAFALAAEAYARQDSLRRVGVLEVYAVVLAVAILAGMAAMGPSRVAGTPGALALILSIPAGFAIGAVTRWVDRIVTRAFARRSGSRAGAVRGGPTPVRELPSSTGISLTPSALLLGGTQRLPTVPTIRSNPFQSLDVRQFTLAVSVVVAVLEEFFYRGVLLQAALGSNSWVAIPLVAGTVVIFALAHVAFGWRHVFAKTPLGAATAASVFAFESVMPAVVAHVWFNVSVWRDIQRTGGVSA